MAATEALVFDAVRTPRGKGKSNGSLHATKPVDLVVGLMHEMLARNPSSIPNRIDDVVLGCVTPIGDQGARHRQDRGAQGRPAGHRRRRAAQPLLRLRPRGRQHGRAEGRLRLGGPGPRRRRRVDVARADGLRRRRLGDGPGDQLRHALRPAGHRRRPDRDASRASRRDDVDAYAAASQERAAAAQADGCFADSVVPVEDLNGNVVLDHDEFIRPGTTVETLGRPQAVVRDDGRARRLRRRRAAEVPLGREIDHVHTPGNSSGHRRRRRAGGDRQRADRQGARPDAARAHRRHRGLRRRPDDHAHRPRARRAQGAGQGRPDGRRHRPVRDQRGLRRRRAAVHARTWTLDHREGQRQRRRDRHGPPARRDRRHDPRHADRRARAHATSATAWPRCASAAAWASRPIVERV